MANAEAETINRWWGFDDSGDFIERLARSAADPTTISEKRARLEAEPNAADAAALGQYHLTRGEALEAVDYFETAIELGDPGDAHEFDLVMAHAVGLDDEIFTVSELRAAADRALESPHLSADQTVDVVEWVVDGLRKDAPTETAAYIARGLKASENDEGLRKAHQRLRILEALLIDRDEELAASLKREALDEGWEEDPGELNGFAWWCFENQFNLEEAEMLARKGVELAGEDGQKAMILDTLAEIVRLRGDQAGAVALIRQAMELDPENEYYGKQLEEFAGAAVAEASD